MGEIYAQLLNLQRIKADKFFPAYLPHIKSYKHKIRGFNGRGNPTDFSEQEKAEIQKALSMLFKDLGCRTK
jgi:hypothetical protein